MWFSFWGWNHDFLDLRSIILTFDFSFWDNFQIFYFKN